MDQLKIYHKEDDVVKCFKKMGDYALLFKPHEQNFKEWIKSKFEGMPEAGIVFLKSLSSLHFKPKIKIFIEKQGVVAK